MSAGKFECPGLAVLVDHARPGDRLCVTMLDRLGRSLKELLETVQDLTRQVIHLVSLKEMIDTDSAAGELVFHVLGTIAQFGSRLIHERTRAEWPLLGNVDGIREGRGAPRNRTFDDL